MSRIDATDGLIYIFEGKCPGYVTACLFLGIQAAGPSRLLRIRVTLEHRSAADAIGSIGHELQHAIETLTDTRVRTTADMLGIWTRGLNFAKERFETYEAIETGIRIRGELRDLREEISAAPETFIQTKKLY